MRDSPGRGPLGNEPTISIHETAEAEINEAADFYDFEDPGLGNIFIDEVERAIEIIARFPIAATLVRGRVRKNFSSSSPTP